MNYRFNMKRIALFLSFVIMAAACTDLAESNGKLTIDETALTQQFATAGGVAEVTFTTDCDWNVRQYNTNHYSWASITPTSGKAGENTIYITALKNEGTDGREFAFLLNAGADSKEIKVVQKQKDALTVTENKFAFDAFGGQFEIEVVANIDFEYEISADWITVVPTKALESTKINFDVAMNKNISDDRAATVTVKSGDFNEVITVSQTKFVPEWTLSATEAWVACEGGSCEFTFESNQGFEVIAPAVDWVTMTEVDGVYHFEVAPSSQFDVRVAYVNLIGEIEGADSYVTIYQNGRANKLWSKNVVDYEGYDPTLKVRLAKYGDYILLANTNKVYALNPEDGSVVLKYDLPAPVQSFCTDDAGNIVVATDASYGGVMGIYTIADPSNPVPELLKEWNTGNYYGTDVGNLRIRGNIKEKAVMTALVSAGAGGAALMWEFENGECTTWYGVNVPYQVGTVAGGCVAPCGTTFEDGLFYVGYGGDYNLHYLGNPVLDNYENEWTCTYVTGSSWMENYNSISTAEYGGVEYAAILASCHFDYDAADPILLDVTEPASAKYVFKHAGDNDVVRDDAWTNTWWTGKGTYSDVLLMPTENALLVVYVDSNYGAIACVAIK